MSEDITTISQNAEQKTGNNETYVSSVTKAANIFSKILPENLGNQGQSLNDSLLSDFSKYIDYLKELKDPSFLSKLGYSEDLEKRVVITRLIYYILENTNVGKIGLFGGKVDIQKLERYAQEKHPEFRAAEALIKGGKKLRIWDRKKYENKYNEIVTYIKTLIDNPEEVKSNLDELKFLSKKPQDKEKVIEEINWHIDELKNIDKKIKINDNDVGKAMTDFKYVDYKVVDYKVNEKNIEHNISELSKEINKSENFIIIGSYKDFLNYVGHYTSDETIDNDTNKVVKKTNETINKNIKILLEYASLNEGNFNILEEFAKKLNINKKLNKEEVEALNMKNYEDKTGVFLIPKKLEGKGKDILENMYWYSYISKRKKETTNTKEVIYEGEALENLEKYFKMLSLSNNNIDKNDLTTLEEKIRKDKAT
ncbi:MAG: hypothetical protein ACP5UN_01930, partial [Candidatus Micrarchaeia archaeon]